MRSRRLQAAIAKAPKPPARGYRKLYVDCVLPATQGWNTVFWVGAVYVGVQTLESYVITPLIQLEKVSLPPLLVIGFQMLFGVLFGILGLMLATPTSALTMTLTRDLYVEDWLERRGDQAKK